MGDRAPRRSGERSLADARRYDTCCCTCLIGHRRCFHMQALVLERINASVRAYPACVRGIVRNPICREAPLVRAVSRMKSRVKQGRIHWPPLSPARPYPPFSAVEQWPMASLLFSRSVPKDFLPPRRPTSFSFVLPCSLFWTDRDPSAQPPAAMALTRASKAVESLISRAIWRKLQTRLVRGTWALEYHPARSAGIAKSSEAVHGLLTSQCRA